MSQSQNGPAANTRSKRAAASPGLEKLPTELISRIAEQLDTKSLKNLRLCSKRLDGASSYAFAPLIACVPFWFMESSMQRLVGLSESSRWSKHVKTLAIMSSCPERVREAHEYVGFDLPYPPRWTVESPQIPHYRLHFRHTHPKSTLAQPETRFGTMPSVHTLVLYIDYKYSSDDAQHNLLPALYSALPSLTTLQLLQVDTRTRGRSHQTLSLTQYAPWSRMPNLRSLSIRYGYFNTVHEVIDTLRMQKDVLRSIEICQTRLPNVVDLLAALQHELPHLEKVVFEYNTEKRTCRDVWFYWADGEHDRGEHAREMVEGKGIRETLGEMIAGYHLGGL